MSRMQAFEFHADRAEQSYHDLAEDFAAQERAYLATCCGDTDLDQAMAMGVEPAAMLAAGTPRLDEWDEQAHRRMAMGTDNGKALAWVDRVRDRAQEIEHQRGLG